MFINLSNHPSENWSKKQMDEAISLGGEVIDVPFPNVDGIMGEKEVLVLANEYVEGVLHLSGGKRDAVVMVQGEFTLTFAVVKKLLELGYKVVSACSNRKVTEKINFEDGKVIKEVEFEFIRYREYR